MNSIALYKGVYNMKTKEAVEHVLINENISKYRLAKNLGIQPIMIDNYLNKNTRMGEETADKFKNLYNITIEDIYCNKKDINESKTTSS